MRVDLSKPLQYFGHLMQLDPVVLQVLSSREMAISPIIFSSDMRQSA